MNANGAPAWLAVIGAAGGVFAVVWTLWRAYREREQLHIRYFLFGQNDAAMIGVDIANVGTLPTQVTWARITQKLHWTSRWPVRLMSFRTRDRRWVRFFLQRTRYTYRTMPGYQGDVIPARGLHSFRLHENDVTDDLRKWPEEYAWIVINTALRLYVSRIRVNYP